MEVLSQTFNIVKDVTGYMKTFRSQIFGWLVSLYEFILLKSPSIETIRSVAQRFKVFRDDDPMSSLFLLILCTFTFLCLTVLQPEDLKMRKKLNRGLSNAANLAPLFVFIFFPRVMSSSSSLISYISESGLDQMSPFSDSQFILFFFNFIPFIFFLYIGCRISFSNINHFSSNLIFISLHCFCNSVPGPELTDGLSYFNPYQNSLTYQYILLCLSEILPSIFSPILPFISSLILYSALLQTIYFVLRFLTVIVGFISQSFSKELGSAKTFEERIIAAYNIARSQGINY